MTGISSGVLCAELPVTAPTVPIRLHPLVLLNISDGVTRADYISYRKQLEGTAMNLESGLSVLGILLGRVVATSDQAEAVLEAVTSFEVVFEGIDGYSAEVPYPPPSVLQRSNEEDLNPEDPAVVSERCRQWFVDTIDWEAVSDKTVRMLEVFPELSVIGWYVVGSTTDHLSLVSAQIHAKVEHIIHAQRHTEETASSETPLLCVVLDTRPGATAQHSRLPLHIFQCHTEKGPGDINAGGSSVAPERGCIYLPLGGTAAGTRLVLTHVKYKMESEEIENVAVDAAMNAESQLGAVDVGASSTALGAQLKPSLARLERSLRLMRSRVLMVAAYLRLLQTGRGSEPLGAADREMLRQVSLLACHVSCSAPTVRAVSRATDSDGGNTTVAADELARTAALAMLALQTRVSMSMHQLSRNQTEAMQTVMMEIQSQDEGERHTQHDFERHHAAGRAFRPPRNRPRF